MITSTPIGKSAVHRMMSKVLTDMLKMFFQHLLAQKIKQHIFTVPVHKLIFFFLYLLCRCLMLETAQQLMECTTTSATTSSTPPTKAT